jgi:curved DNA-binding protein CbpA
MTSVRLAASRGDHYGVLGVRRNAPQSEVKAAAKRLQFAHHPDKGGDGQLGALINAAADVLKDPARRAYYDLWLCLGTQEAARKEARDATERSKRRDAQAEALREAARREQETRERGRREAAERQRRWAEEAAKEEEYARISSKGWRRRVTKEVRFPFVPLDLPEGERVDVLARQWRQKKLQHDGEKKEEDKAHLKKEMDEAWAKAAKLRDQALDAERASRFPRCTPTFKRERPEDAEAIGQLYKRYRAAKARESYHEGLDDDAAEEERELCREAWRVQLGTPAA